LIAKPAPIREKSEYERAEALSNPSAF